MAGTATDRIIAPASRAAGFAFSVATKPDDPELRRFLGQRPTPGRISLRFEREPDYFLGHDQAAERHTTIIARKEGSIHCMGHSVRRRLYVDGAPRSVGYLGELRLDPEAPGGLRALRDGFAFFESLEKDDPADCYFTSIAASNTRARKVLESARLGLPAYHRFARLHTLAIPVRRAFRNPTAPSDIDPQSLTSFFDQSARSHDLAMPWDSETFPALSPLGFAPKNAVSIFNGQTPIAGACLWDQRSWKQTVVHRYSPSLRWTRPFLSATLALLGQPRLPREGSPLRCAVAFPFAVSPNAPEPLALQLLAVLEKKAAARGIDWILLGLPDAHPLLPVLRKRLGVQRYETLLYSVQFPNLPKPACSPGRSALPDIALL